MDLNYDLTLKIPGGGEIHTRHPIDQIVPYLGIGSGPLISLNSGMSILVVLPPFWGPPDGRVNSEPPGKLMDQQIYKFWNYKKFKFPKKYCIPLFGVAPRDPRVWPLEA